jgi:hypothetical protein
VVTDKKWRPHDLHDLTEEEAIRLSRMNPAERERLIDEMTREEFMKDPAHVSAVNKTQQRIRQREFFGLRTDGPARAMIFFRYLGRIPGPVWAANKTARRTRLKEYFGLRTDRLTEVETYLRYLRKFHERRQRR